MVKLIILAYSNEFDDVNDALLDQNNSRISFIIYLPEKQERNIDISPFELCFGTLEPLSVHSFSPSYVKPSHFASINKDVCSKKFSHILSI